ncbi:MAG: sigma-70 family RNA polymerase sigma factor [Clostridia bacterium]|nr:sigma-70 family RNA polymerase sigma factor [Clostridia bacterium]
MNIEKRINDNLKLVHLCCHRMKDKGIEYDELYSTGCLGLVKAAKKFDETKGFQFSTYAVPVILGEMKQLFRDNNPIKISRKLKELSIKANCEIEAQRKMNKEPSIQEIAQKLNCSKEDVIEALNAVNFLKSLDTDESIANKISQNDEEKTLNRIALLQAIEKLNTQEQQIVDLRFFKDKTQTETAKILGLTQVQVSRKEKNVLKTLKNQLIS